MLKKKGSRILFLFSVLSLAFQTALTFFLLFKSTEGTVLNSIILGLSAIYVFAFLGLLVFGLGSRRLSKDGVHLFKASVKVIKRLMNLLLVLLSILSIISASKINYGLLLYSILMLAYNIFLIALDFFISSLKQKYKKAKKRREQLKRQEEMDDNQTLKTAVENSNAGKRTRLSSSRKM